MMTLPFPPRKAYLRSLWLLSNLVAALVLGSMMAVLTGPLSFAVTVVAFGGLALVGLPRHAAQLKLYRLWNRGAARLRKDGFRWILFVSHGVLLRAIGAEGSKFDGADGRAASTGWTSYPLEFRSASPADRFGPIDEIAPKGWIRHYLAWARADGNRWSLLLLPFLMSLSLFSQSEENTSAPSNIYTLF